MPIYNLKTNLHFGRCQEQMITSKRIKLQTSNTTHLKEHFKIFPTVIWFLYLHDLDVEKKTIFLMSMNFGVDQGVIWTSISESSLLPNEWSYYLVQPLSWKIFSGPFKWSYCFHVYLNIKLKNIAKHIWTILIQSWTNLYFGKLSRTDDYF